METKEGLKLSQHLLRNISDSNLNDEFSPSFCSLVLFVTQKFGLPIELTEVIGWKIYSLGFHPVVRCGYYHSLALTNTGHVYLWGANIIADDVNCISPSTLRDPVKIEIENISNIISGITYALLLTRKGELYSFGYNSIHGQLGINSIEDNIYSPGQISLQNVIKVSAGYYHSLALTKDNKLFSWGKNSNCQLGLGHRRDFPSPQLINLPPELEIEDIQCGGNFSLFKTKDNRIYTFGENMYGQLGYTYGDVDVPQRIDFVEDISMISCGNNHVMALTKNGEIYSWGSNEGGQLGLNRGDAFAPERINFPKKFKHINCGINTLFAISTDGEIYSWGQNDMGGLGIGDVEGARISHPTPTNLNYHEVDMISSGFHFSLALSRDGSLIGWGSNDYEQLGMDQTKVGHSSDPSMSIFVLSHLLLFLFPLLLPLLRSPMRRL